MEAGSWCTIESDPGIFTELIETIGVKDTQVEELYSLAEDTFIDKGKVHGLIFLFKWRSETDDRLVEPCDSEIFFATQEIQNACATQAILSILMNSPGVDIGDELRHFKEFTKEFSPQMKGLAISNCDLVRNAHNSFKRSEPFVYSGVLPAKEDDDVYHFISYLPIGGSLYELDGLKKGPINLGPCSEDNWLELVKPVISERIERYSKEEIRFNLLAVIERRDTVYKKEKSALEAEIAELTASLTGMSEGSPGRVEAENTIANLGSRIAVLNNKLLEEEEKFRNWKAENVRRKHNYIPFIMNMLQILAKRGELMPLVQKASKEDMDT